MKQYIAMMAMMALIAITGLMGQGRGQGRLSPDKEPLQPQTRCPAMDGMINKSLFVEYEGKRIYVCCKECLETVKKDPAKYINKLENDGVALEKIQTTCPVLGGKIDKKIYTDYQGKRVYFCCSGCVAEFKKAPEKYLKKMEAEGVSPEPVPAATATEKKEASKMTCPMMPKSDQSHSSNKGDCGM